MVAILKLDARAVLASNMKGYRRSQKLTQKELSWFTGLSKTYIKNIENLNEKANIDDIYLIAKALNVRFDVLLKNT